MSLGGENFLQALQQQKKRIEEKASSEEKEHLTSFTPPPTRGRPLSAIAGSTSDVTGSNGRLGRSASEATKVTAVATFGGYNRVDALSKDHIGAYKTAEMLLTKSMISADQQMTANEKVVKYLAIADDTKTTDMSISDDIPMDDTASQTTGTLTVSSTATGRRKKKKKKRRRQSVPSISTNASDGRRSPRVHHINHTHNFHRKRDDIRSLATLPSDAQLVTPPPLHPMNDSRNGAATRERAADISIIEGGVPPRINSGSNNGGQWFKRKSYPPRLLWTYIFGFISAVDLLINLPTLYDATLEKTDEKWLYIWIFAVYVLCQIIGSLFGAVWIDRKSITLILIVSAFLLLFGNLLYTHGVSSDDDSVFLLMVGRALCGFSASILVIGYAHVTKVSYRWNLEERIVWFRFVTALGMVVGPLLGVLLSTGNQTDVGVWKIRDTNAGSFLMIFTSLAYIALFSLHELWSRYRGNQASDEKISASKHRTGDIWTRKDSADSGTQLKEKPNRSMAPYQLPTGDAMEVGGSATSDDIRRYRTMSDEERRVYSHSLVSRHTFLLLLVYTSSLFTFWSFEAAIIPVGQSNGDFTTTELYGIFAFISVVYILSFFANGYINRCIVTSPSKRVIGAMLLMAVGCQFLTTLGLHRNDKQPLWQLIVGGFFLTVGFSIATIQSPAIYCRISEAKKKNIGVRLSWFFIISSVGRLGGPIYGFCIIRLKNDTYDFLAHSFTLWLLFVTFCAFTFLLRADPSRLYPGDKKESLSNIPNVTAHNTALTTQPSSTSIMRRSVTPSNQSQSPLPSIPVVSGVRGTTIITLDDEAVLGANTRISAGNGGPKQSGMFRRFVSSFRERTPRQSANIDGDIPDTISVVTDSTVSRMKTRANGEMEKELYGRNAGLSSGTIGVAPVQTRSSIIGFGGKKKSQKAVSKKRSSTWDRQTSFDDDL